MKKFLNVLLTFAITLTNVLAAFNTVHASTVIPTVYIDGYTAGTGEGDDAKILIKLDSPATETTTVWYRTQLGTAHNLSTVVSLSKFIDFKDEAVVFNAGESSKEVIVPHYETDSYEEVSRFYTVQLYKVSGNALIDKSRDLLEVWHREDTNTNITTGNHTLYQDSSWHFQDPNGTVYKPNTTGVSWNNVPYEGRYWSRIRAEFAKLMYCWIEYEVLQQK